MRGDGRGKVTRREALRFGALGAGVLLVPVGLKRAGVINTPASATAGEFLSPRRPPFEAELAIPPVLQPVRSTSKKDFYEVTERASTTEIIPGITTPIWGYNGISPGPTIQARKGRTVVVTFFNRVPPDGDPAGLIIPHPQDPEDHPFRDSSTVVHLHGINTDPRSDGYPENTILPGGQFTHIYPNNSYQRPATLWYHDHSVHITGEHVYRGLAAFYILTDEIEDELPLPRGEFDVPLVIQDKVIDPGGVLVYQNEGHKGVEGDVIAVNGRQQPRFEVANRKYRFRILNGSDAREYRLALSDDSPFTVIGSDQGLLGAPVEVRSLRSTPAERCEIVIDFSRYPIGTRVVLENRLPEAQDRSDDAFDPNSPTAQVMAFDVNRRASDDSRIPAVLRPDRIPLTGADRKREWRFDRQGGYWSINGEQWDPNRVDAFPKLNSTEIWRFVNNSGGWTHPVHPHMVRFLIVSIDGRAPTPAESGWKDTVWLGPNQEISVIMQFRNFRGKFAFHCHNSSHEDHDMMTQFEVV